MKMLIAVVFGLFFINSSLFSQDTIRLLNGSILEVRIDKISDEEISFTSRTKNITSFQVRSAGEVFSYTKDSEPEVLVYKYNPEIGNFYKVPEMREFMVGEQHADRYHKTWITKISALGVGAVAGYSVSKGNGLLVASPLIYSSIMIIPRGMVQKNEFNEEVINNEPYRAGYRRVSRSRRFLNNLAYSAIGMVSSMLIYEIAD